MQPRHCLRRERSDKDLDFLASYENISMGLFHFQQIRFSMKVFLTQSMKFHNENILLLRKYFISNQSKNYIKEVVCSLIKILDKQCMFCFNQNCQKKFRVICKGVVIC